MPTTDVGSNWHEQVGDWGLLNDELVEKYDTSEGTAGAIVICTKPVPAPWYRTAEP